jgi:hypothetical protein
MRNAQMQVFNDLHVVTRHNDAGVAHSEHSASGKSRESSRDAAGLLCHL